MRRSKERVTALGFFETVDITQKPGSADNKIVLQVEVKEKATGTFQVGLGFSNVENFIFTAQVSQNNFLGWGQSVSASAQISGLKSLVQLSFYDPYFLDTQYLLSADFYRVDADYDGFVRRSTGGSVSLGYQFVDDVLGTVGYTREYVDVEAGQALGSVLLANQFLSGVTSAAAPVALLRSPRQPPVPVARLHPLRLGGVRPRLLGGTFLFTRYTAYSRLYFPLPLGLVFKTNATVGYIQQLDPNKPAAHLRALLPGRHQHRARLLPAQHQPHADGASLRARRMPPSPSSARAATSSSSSTWSWSSPSSRRPASAACSSTTRATPTRPTSASSRTGRTRCRSASSTPWASGSAGSRPVGPLRFEWGFPLTKRPEDEPYLFEFTIGNFF